MKIDVLNIDTDKYPRYFNLSAMRITFTALNADEVERVKQWGGVEINETVHHYIKTGYEAKHV